MLIMDDNRIVCSHLEEDDVLGNVLCDDCYYKIIESIP